VTIEAGQQLLRYRLLEKIGDGQHYISMEYVDGEDPSIVWRRSHHAAM
jgi:hypothetical protein